jgi:hypothetical protein
MNSALSSLRKPTSRPFTVRALFFALNAGNRIAIYGGSGCTHAHDQVVALAERLQAPVARTSRAKDFLGHHNPFDVGMTGLFGTKGGYLALTECDTLLLLGCDFAWRQFYPERATVIQIDIDGAHLGRRHPVDIGAVGDIAPTLEALLPKIKPRKHHAFLDAALAEARKAEAKLNRRAVPRSGSIHPQYLVETIAAHAAPDDGSLKLLGRLTRCLVRRRTPSVGNALNHQGDPGDRGRAWYRFHPRSLAVPTRRLRNLLQNLPWLRHRRSRLLTAAELHDLTLCSQALPIAISTPGRYGGAVAVWSGREECGVRPRQCGRRAG